MSAGIGGALSSYNDKDTSVNGFGGKGGKVKVSEKASVNAYNGSYITTKDGSSMSDSEKQSTQALIYAQAGYSIKDISELHRLKVVNSRTIENLVKEWSSLNEYRIISSPYKNGENSGKFILGIGSGAGGQQESDGNGTYTIDTSLN